MPYMVIQPPISKSLRETPKKELKRYFHWFMDIMPKRISILADEVKRTKGFEAWTPDLTPASLDQLGAWFSGRVELRNRTSEEMERLQSLQSFPFPVSDKELTEIALSFAMDIGMYLAQVFLKNHPSLVWDQPLKSRNFIEYGHPVLVNFKPAPLNPVGIVVTLAYGLASKKKTGGDLRKIYDIWSRLLQS